MSSSFAETINSMREGTLFEVKINNDTPNNKTYADFITELEKTDTSNITLQNCGIKGKRLDSFLDAISKNKKVQQIVITSYSIHYTKLYEKHRNEICINHPKNLLTMGSCHWL